MAAAGRHNLIMIGPPGSGEPGDIEMAASRRSYRH
ncbi:ATP-binding protein [Stieleria sedimenti]